MWYSRGRKTWQITPANTMHGGAGEWYAHAHIARRGRGVVRNCWCFACNSARRRAIRAFCARICALGPVFADSGAGVGIGSLPATHGQFPPAVIPVFLCWYTATHADGTTLAKRVQLVLYTTAPTHARPPICIRAHPCLPIVGLGPRSRISLSFAGKGGWVLIFSQNYG
jgi:hypothetical protein